jgi:hypothetical protein
MSNDNPNGKMYAVFRNGQRVSEAEYPDPFFAQKELEHWQNIIKRNPDGSRVEVKSVKTPSLS